MTQQKRAYDLSQQCRDKMPRCQAFRTNSYYNDTPDTDRQCSHKARFKVEGRYLCLRHAEVKALAILMSEDERWEPDGPVCTLRGLPDDVID